MVMFAVGVVFEFVTLPENEGLCECVSDDDHVELMEYRVSFYRVHEPLGCDQKIVHPDILN